MSSYLCVAILFAGCFSPLEDDVTGNYSSDTDQKEGWDYSNQPESFGLPLVVEVENLPCRLGVAYTVDRHLLASDG